MLVKIIDNGYILGLAEAPTGTEITEEEYNELTAIFHAMPVKEGYAYKLRESDLEWEEYPVEPEPEDEIQSDEALSILLGGESE